MRKIQHPMVLRNDGTQPQTTLNSFTCYRFRSFLTLNKRVVGESGELDWALDFQYIQLFVRLSQLY